jgi:hypothetical protein
MEKPMTMNTKYLALLAAALLLPASVFAAESTTTFRIHKIWDQGGDIDARDAQPVTGHLSCTGADITQQNVVFTATTDAILFVYDISEIPGDAQVNCQVWETVPDNYSADYDCNDDDCGDTEDGGLNHCAYLDVGWDQTYTCDITNTPHPAVVTVTKTWVIDGSDQGFNESHQIEAQCDSEVWGGIGSDNWGCGGDCRGVDYEVDDAVDGIYEFTIPNPNYPATQCEFYEEHTDSVVDTDNGCGDINLSAGEEVECEIVNTVFFEGIPTLSQYGMAILALLMLGVGFVGFRRFV